MGIYFPHSLNLIKSDQYMSGTAKIGGKMENPFIRKDASTLANVESAISNDAELSSARKASLRSALNKLSKALNLPLTSIPADVDFIRVKLARLTPAEVGLTPRRFSTVKSEVKFAFKHLGLIGGSTYLHPITGPWGELWDVLPSKYAKTTFSRLFRYCSKHGIQPEAVTDKVLDDFRRALEVETFVKDPRVVHQNNARVWNQMRGKVVGWPDVVLTVPRYADHYIRDWATFPDSLRTDVDAFLARQGSKDLFDVEGPPRPLKLQTLRKYGYELRRTASILVECGHDPATLQSLGDLVVSDRVAEVLRFILSRTGKRKSQSASDLATLLAKVAKYYVKVPAEELDRIKRFSARVRPPSGLSRKNRDRIAPLRDPANLAKLFLLPNKIRKTVEARPKPSRSDALLMQHAVALSILTYAPIRISNLGSLTCDHHLQWTQRGQSGELVIDFDGDEVKNNQSLSFPLPRECASLIRLYLRKYRPLLVAEGTRFLFPGPISDCPKRSDTLSKQLSRRIHTTIGLRVNPHLYRHLVHIIVLQRFPGAYAMVSRVLGHKSLQTAIANYAAEDINISMQAFQELIQEVRSNTAPLRNMHAAAYGFEVRHF